MSEPTDLFALLHLTPDANPQRLRHAYEWAVTDATRRGDWVRTRWLAQLFDRLPAATKAAVYGSMEGAAAPGAPVTGASRWEARISRRFGAAEDGAAAARAAPSPPIRWPFKVMLVFIALFCALGVIALLIHLAQEITR
jgi:hypothetical protein